MGATQSVNGASTPTFSPLPQEKGPVSYKHNNQAAVAALLAERFAAQHAAARRPDPSSSNLASASSSSSSSSSSPARPPPQCPMHNSNPAPPPMPKSKQAQCPIDHSAFSSGSSSSSSSGNAGEQTKKGWSETLNPLNNMPTLFQTRDSSQQTALSTERTISSIPRAPSSPAPGASPYDKAEGAAPDAPESTDKWENPSPQQFYNALVRKGWETPEEHIETMVLIHNFLNERAWLEVLEWEKRAGVDPSKVELARFQGKPGTLSPKARFFGLAGKVFPSRFSDEPPFDRHDWVIRRPSATSSSATSPSTTEEVRYVIDYYSAPDDPETDEPVFNLDVRPALDSVGSARVRFGKSLEEVREWWSQGQAQQAGQAQAQAQGQKA